MISTSDLREALREPFRQYLKDTAELGSDVSWVDEFCDALILRLPEFKDDYKMHLWKQRDGHYQVNIDEGNRNAYTIDVTDDPLRVIGERLAPELVRHTDAYKDGADSQGEPDSSGVRDISAGLREDSEEGEDASPTIPGLLIHEI